MYRIVKKLNSLIIISVLITGACTSNNVFINREEDNNEGKVFLNKFYNNIAKKNFEYVDSVLSDSLKLIAGSKGISDALKYINNKAGNYRNFMIDDHFIRCMTGSKNETSYNYKLKVVYNKGTVDEIIGLKKEDGSDIKINSYHANSDLLIH